jgi:hypothetical protein
MRTAGRRAAGAVRSYRTMRGPTVDIRHLRTLARLRRVNRQLALCDELEAMALMPPSLLPWVEVAVLDPETLRNLPYLTGTTGL